MMLMRTTLRMMAVGGLAAGLGLAACGEREAPKDDQTATGQEASAGGTAAGGGQDDRHADDGHGHDHPDGHAGDGHGHDHGDEHAKDDGHGHDHDEVPLGTAKLGDLEVECWQGHGKLAAGKEMHLVVKLPFNDGGATVVRAWIGTSDRMGSRVAKGEYAPSHDDYDIHAEAPDPLPADTRWWIEVDRPDDPPVVGSITPR